MRVTGSSPAGTDTRRVLFECAAKATLAPSILNTQPWRWLVHRASLDLYADWERQVPSIDPEGRQLMISCGGALHHASVILRARGLAPDVARLPDPTEPALLARIHVSAQAARWADIAEAATIDCRHSDRRLIASTCAVSEHVVDGLRRAAERYGAGLHRITEQQRPILRIAAATAQTALTHDETYQRELNPWTDDPFADYLTLASPDDRISDWLRTGEAMSAVWLTATAHTVSASVLSDVIEVPDARALVACLMPDPGYPQVVLRIGVAAHHGPTPASRRGRPEDVIDIDEST